MRLEETETSDDAWEQRIYRSWNFLKMTHTLESRDVIPELYDHREHNYFYNEQEWMHYIKSFDDAGFWDYYNFMKKRVPQRCSL